MERMEIHSRKLNLRMFGLKNDIVKGDPVVFMIMFSKEMFKGELGFEPTVEIACRVGPLSGVGPTYDCKNADI